MEPSVDPWVARWTEGKIGFHEGKPNAFLDRHIARLGPGRRVFVPLCGKAEDLAYLGTRGHQVIGVELVEDAVRAFFAEHALEPIVTPCGPLTKYTSGTITIFAGDLFATTAELVGPLDALYDRAALIALPPELRSRYMAHLRALLPAGARGLVITLEYPQDKMAGPPFSVLEAELRSYYAGLEVVTIDEAVAETPRLKELGVTAFERCFAVRF